MNRTVKTLLLAVLFALTSPVRSQELGVTAHLSPQPPWSTTEPVWLTVAVTNTGSAPAYANVDIEGMTRLDNLVDGFAFQSDPASCFGVCDASLDLPPYDLMFCISTRVIQPGETVTCQFEVLAWPEANGARPANLVIDPRQPDGAAAVGDVLGNNSAPLFFFYGTASPVPGLRSYAVFLMVLLVAGFGWRDARRGSRLDT